MDPAAGTKPECPGLSFVYTVTKPLLFHQQVALPAADAPQKVTVGLDMCRVPLQKCIVGYLSEGGAAVVLLFGDCSAFPQGSSYSAPKQTRSRCCPDRAASRWGLGKSDKNTAITLKIIGGRDAILTVFCCIWHLKNTTKKHSNLQTSLQLSSSNPTGTTELQKVTFLLRVYHVWGYYIVSWQVFFFLQHFCLDCILQCSIFTVYVAP